MNSSLYHLQINIDYQNSSFYKDLMQFLGWEVIFEGEDMIGYKADKGGDLWFVQSEKDGSSDYDNTGVNHISLRVAEQINVDEVVNFLKQKDVEPLFGTPNHRPEFAASENETYYQVMFESPDKILFEVVYIGSKF
jgi:catechol 2,3-dioxygenase-like lactoylglutathione lyase family enzyme